MDKYHKNKDIFHDLSQHIYLTKYDSQLFLYNQSFGILSFLLCD